MKNKLFGFISILIVTIVSVIGFAGCNNTSKKTDSSNNLTTVRFAALTVGVGDNITNLAIEKGIYKKHGIDLKVVHFPSGGPEALAGTVSGQVDMGSFGTPILTGIAKGVPIKIVASPEIKTSPFVLVVSNDIKTVQDLKGKTVSTGAVGGGANQSFQKILEVNNIKLSDVKALTAGGTDAEAVLKSGKVAGVITSEPTVSKIEVANEGHTLVNAVDIFGNYQHSYVFASDKFIKTNPNAIKKYLAAKKEELEYAKEHQDELISKGVKDFGLSKELLTSYYKNTIPQWDSSLKVNEEGLNNAVKILQGFGDIDKSITLPSSDESKWLNKNFLK